MTATGPKSAHGSCGPSRRTTRADAGTLDPDLLVVDGIEDDLVDVHALAVGPRDDLVLQPRHHLRPLRLGPAVIEGKFHQAHAAALGAALDALLAFVENDICQLLRGSPRPPRHRQARHPSSRTRR